MGSMDSAMSCLRRAPTITELSCLSATAMTRRVGFARFTLRAPNRRPVRDRPRPAGKRKRKAAASPISIAGLNSGIVDKSWLITCASSLAIGYFSG